MSSQLNRLENTAGCGMPYAASGDLDGNRYAIYAYKNDPELVVWVGAVRFNLTKPAALELARHLAAAAHTPTTEGQP